MNNRNSKRSQGRSGTKQTSHPKRHSSVQDQRGEKGGSKHGYFRKPSKRNRRRDSGYSAMPKTERLKRLTTYGEGGYFLEKRPDREE